MGSQLFPNKFNGQLRSSGYLMPNSYKGQNAKAPDWKGRAYLIGLGWVWVAAWKKSSSDGSPMFSISFQDMTDEETTKYCARADRGHRPATQNHQRDEEADSDIPF